jgi:hypothetical protein
MDIGKHVAFARRVSLAIMALGLTALYTLWTDTERNETLRIFNQLEQILAVRNLLVQRQPNDGVEVKVADLSHVEGRLYLATDMFPTICDALEHIKSQDKLNIPMCDSAEIQQKYLLGMTVNDLQTKLPNARGFDLAGLRSEWGQTCPAIIFNGSEHETFWIKGIGSTAQANQVQGSLVYYVRLGIHCRLSRLDNEAPAFFLVDLRSVRGGWHFYAGEKLTEAVLGAVGYRRFKDSFVFNEQLRMKKGNDGAFDTDRFFHDLPAPYKTRFIANVPSRFFVLPVTNIETRIIGESYVRTGVLHTPSELDSALSSIYNVEKISPTVAGVGTNLRLWISISPLIFVILSFFFWYHVKRIARADSAINEPWLFIDAAGYVEKTFAAVWALVLTLSAVPIIWAVLNNYEVALPRLSLIVAWLGLNRDPIHQIILRDAMLSWPAAIGTAIVGSAAFLLVYSFHLLLYRGSINYSRFLTILRSSFTKFIHLIAFGWAHIRRRISSSRSQMMRRKAKRSRSA